MSSLAGVRLGNSDHAVAASGGSEPAIVPREWSGSVAGRPGESGQLPDVQETHEDAHSMSP